jgi:GNAT superfamily N-acetyltransferase
MASGQASIRRADQPGDLGWVIMAHGESYASEFGWDTSFEALVARIVADYADGHDPAREAAWIAELDGQRVGCVFCVAQDERTAKLRILLVDPGARGHRLGGRLVDTCVEFARSAGYEHMLLWTNHPLTAARHIYLRRGFVLTEQEPHHSFGVDLVGQVYELDLAKVPVQLTHAAAAVDADHLPGHEAGVRTGKVGDCPGDVLDRARAGQRDEVGRPVEHREELG